MSVAALTSLGAIVDFAKESTCFQAWSPGSSMPTWPCIFTIAAASLITSFHGSITVHGYPPDMNQAKQAQTNSPMTPSDAGSSTTAPTTLKVAEARFGKLDFEKLKMKLPALFLKLLENVMVFSEKCCFEASRMSFLEVKKLILEASFLSF